LMISSLRRPLRLPRGAARSRLSKFRLRSSKFGVRSSVRRFLSLSTEVHDVTIALASTSASGFAKFA
jgi:hypothetical protein